MDRMGVFGGSGRKWGLEGWLVLGWGILNNMFKNFGVFFIGNS